jgi:hypothetical protein
MKKSALFLSLFFLSSIMVYAQSGFKKGWIVLNNKDTVNGQLLFKNWNLNPSSVTFRADKEFTYKIEDLLAFGLAGEAVVYRRFKVKKHLTPNNESATYQYDEDSTDISTQWLKLLVAGNNSLYIYANSDRPYFFFQEGNEVIELEYSNGIKNFSSEKYRNDPRFEQTGLQESNVYKNQLIKLAATKGERAEQLVSIVNYITYNENGLTNYFESLNKTNRNDKSKMKFNFSLGGGLISNMNKNSGITEAYFYNVQLNNTITPFFNIGFEFQPNNKIKHIGFNGNIRYSSINSDGTKKIRYRQDSGISYKLRNNFIEAGIAIRYTINPASKIRIYAEVGPNFMFSVKKSNTVQKKYYTGDIILNELAVSSFFIRPVFGAGIWYKNIRLFTQYEQMPNMTTYAEAEWTAGRLIIGLAFDLKK